MNGNTTYISRLINYAFPVPEGASMNLLNLKFRDKEMESRFLDDYFKESRVLSRYLAMISVFIYSAFIVLDYFLLPELLKSFIIIRFGIVVPLAVAIVILSFTRIYKNIFQPLLAFLIFVGGAGIIAMIYLSREYTGNVLLSTYFAGLMLIFIFAYNFMKVRFGWASLSCWAIFWLYEYVVFKQIELSSTTIIVSNFFLFSANVMAAISGYHYEFITRKNFFLKHRLGEEKSRFEDMNRNLEVMVSKRTHELEDATRRAIESDQLKTMFLANISHELRTPMNGILGFSSLLSTTELDPEKRNHFVKIINERGQYLMGILDNLIDISMIESRNLVYNPEKIEVNSFLRSLKSFLDSFFVESGGKFILNLQEENTPVVIKTDKVKLEQIITNLVSNASKYAESKLSTLGYKIDGERVILFVKDEGPGIPEHYKPHIFKTFVKGDKNIKDRKNGTGLGLAISKGLAEFLGAELSFESEEGKGTTFYLDFGPTE